MPIQEKDTPIVEFDFDDLQEAVEEAKEATESVDESVEDKGFFAKLGSKIKEFFRGLRDTLKNVGAAVINRVVLGKTNYNKVVKDEYNEARKNRSSIFDNRETQPDKETEERTAETEKHTEGYYAATVVDKKGDSLVVDINGEEKEISAGIDTCGCVMSYDVGEEIPLVCETSYFIIGEDGKTHKVTNEPKFRYAGEPTKDTEFVNKPEGVAFNSHTNYNAEIKKLMPEKNLVIIDVNGKEATIHKSELGDKKISDLQVGTMLAVQYNGTYTNDKGVTREIFTTQRFAEVNDIHLETADAVEKFREEQRENKIEPEREEPQVDESFGEPEQSPDELFPEEVAVIGEEPTPEEKTVTEKETITEEPMPAETTEKLNVKSLDVASFKNAVAQGKDGEYTLYGGGQKGPVVEVKATINEGEVTYFSGKGLVISKSKAEKLCDKHNNVGDIKGAFKSLINKEKPDRAESAFEPTVFTYQNQAILLTNDGQVIPVSPDTLETNQEVVQEQATERNETDSRTGAGSGSTQKDTVESPFDKESDNSLDNADSLVNEAFEEDIVNENEVLNNYDAQLQQDSTNDERNNPSDFEL